MKINLFSAFAFLCGTVLMQQTYAVGFQRATVTAETPIDIGIWYPSSAAIPNEINTPFRQKLAINADPEGDKLTLIVLSHGDGGWMGGHADTALALAEAGYVAVAVTHPGNNYEDESAPPSKWLVSRPADIVETINYMLTSWFHASLLLPDNIGVFGFSAGGYTALAAARAKPDIDRTLQHCAVDPTEFVCQVGMIDEIAASSFRSSKATLASDPRIRAISIAAPGLGFAFDPQGLAKVTIPVQIWSGALDDRVPHASNGLNLDNSLPEKAEVHIIEDAGHFAFLSPCNPALEKANPRIWHMVCVDAPGFDRKAFHNEMNAEIIAFFDRTLRK
ncbi:MAG: hypothetical protein R3F53_23345 [Gammaproteobacteria bacterium]